MNKIDHPTQQITSFAIFRGCSCSDFNSCSCKSLSLLKFLPSVRTAVDNIGRRFPRNLRFLYQEIDFESVRKKNPWVSWRYTTFLRYLAVNSISQLPVDINNSWRNTQIGLNDQDENLQKPIYLTPIFYLTHKNWVHKIQNIIF